jgi:transcriptional regulator with XRE-family HTH domain
MNRGAAALVEKIKEERLTQNEAARQLEEDSGNFSKICRGDRNPGRLLSHRLFQRWGIEPEWFDQELPSDTEKAS